MHTVAYPSCNNLYLFEKFLDDKVHSIVKEFSSGKQTLIFCSSKKGTETLASKLSSHLASFFPRLDVGSVTRDGHSVATMLSSLTDALLQQLCRKGYAYHHAGLPPNDREIVEKLFLHGALHVLCSTSTLAHGVNLPAHLVVIKGNVFIG